MDYRCARCGVEEVVEIAQYGVGVVTRMCAECGSEEIHRFDASDKYKRYQPPSVGQMLHRVRKAESHLPPSPMEQVILARKNAEARDDLLNLLTELA